MIDMYSDRTKRRLRARGIEELTQMANDIGDLENAVLKLPWHAKRYHTKKLGQNFRQLQDPYECLVFERLHEVHNCAYESTIDYMNSHNKFKAYFQ